MQWLKMGEALPPFHHTLLDMVPKHWSNSTFTDHWFI